MAPAHQFYLLVPGISCRFQGQWWQTVGARPSADQTGPFTVQFKVTSPLWVLTSNSLIRSRAGCTFMYASANHCLPPLLGVPLFVAQLQPSPGTCARLDTEACFPTMATMVTPGETLGCLFWPSCGERKEGKLQLCVVDELCVVGA